MLRAVCRSFATWTSKEWVSQASMVQKELESLEWSVYRRAIYPDMFQISLEGIQKRIRLLSTAQFKQGEAPQFQRQMIEELQENAGRVSSFGQKAFWDRRKD